MSSPNDPSASYLPFEALFETYRYPAGESHVRQREGVPLPQVVEAKVSGFESLAQLVTADRILRRRGRSLRWFVPYFPFARHDRRNDAYDGLELELALELAAQVDLRIADPHSDVTARLPHIPQHVSVQCFREAGLFEGDPWIVIPDVGAAKKVGWRKDGEAALQAMKKRDPMSGALSGFQLLHDDLGGRPVVIVDDICDGGGTFLGLAETLRAKGAGPLRLAVTHGLFTKGVERILQHYAQVYTFHFQGRAHSASGVVSLPFRRLYEKGIWL